MAAGDFSASTGTWKRRRAGQFAAAISAAAFNTGPRRWLSMAIAMFDCPEASQTSPTTTWLIEDGGLSADDRISIVRPTAEALRGLSVTRHAPFVSAVALSSWPANATVIRSPGAAVPQTGAGCPCCSTM